MLSSGGTTKKQRNRSKRSHNELVYLCETCDAIATKVQEKEKAQKVLRVAAGKSVPLPGGVPSQTKLLRSKGGTRACDGTHAELGEARDAAQRIIEAYTTWLDTTARNVCATTQELHRVAEGLEDKGA